MMFSCILDWRTCVIEPKQHWTPGGGRHGLRLRPYPASGPRNRRDVETGL